MSSSRLRGAMVALDQPQERSRGFQILLVASLVLFAATWPVALPIAETPLPVNQGALATASAWVVAATGGAIGILLWWHGSRAGRRGYLILAATWFYGTACLAVFPFTYPNALRVVDPPAPMIGSYQSGAWLLDLTEVVFLIMVPLGAVVIDRDQRLSRPARLTHEPWTYTIVAATVLVVTLLLSIPLVEQLPEVIGEPGQVPPGSAGIAVATLSVAVAGLVVVGRLARRGSMITQWLLVVLLIEFGTVLVVFAGGGGGRGSLGWLWGKVWPMVAMCVMLAVLLWALTRIGRATEDLAYEDWLTGVQTRVRLKQDLDRERIPAGAASDGTALIRMDLDAFQGVNNQFGHATGDEILRQAAARIQALLGNSDQLARLGGDEFGIVLHHTGTRDRHAQEVADDVLDEMRRPFRVGQAVIRLSGSAGVATTQAGSVATSELIAMTDLALSRAKAAGGNCSLVYSAEMGVQAAQDAQLHQALAVAIANSSFDLDYQSVVELGTGRARGAEALVRWVRDGVRVSAGQFLDHAEASGQIVEIDKQVLSHLEQDCPRILAATDPGFQLHVNLSVKELATDELIRRFVDGPLAADAGQIVIEITESEPSATLGDAGSPLATLAAAGYGIAIDDFGTGYSNLARLASLRPSIIKIDRSLVVEATMGDPAGLLGAAVAICQAVGATPIIEGVETPEQAAAMASLGISYAQGFLFAHPVPCPELLDRLAAQPATQAH